MGIGPVELLLNLWHEDVTETEEINTTFDAHKLMIYI